MFIITEPKNMRDEKENMLKEMIMLIPNMVKLLYRLVKDELVPAGEKAILLGAIAYVVSPWDLVPDFIPFLGQVDDLLLICLVLKRFISNVSYDVLCQYWDGNEKLLVIIRRVLDYARYFVPEGVYNKLVKKSEKDYIDVDYEIK